MGDADDADNGGLRGDVADGVGLFGFEYATVGVGVGEFGVTLGCLGERRGVALVLL